MTEKRILAILGLLFGLLAGLLVLVGALTFGRNQPIDLALLFERLVTLVLGIAILFGSVLIYRGTYSGGGLVNLIMGVVVFLVSRDTLAAVLAIVSGVLGFLANEARG